MGSKSLESLRRWRVEALSGDRVGPRIVASGPILDGGNYPDNRVIVGNAAEARRAVDSLAAAGVDFIKLHEHLSREAYFAAASEARRLGIPFAGHIPAGDVALIVTAIEASEAGQRCVEHLNFVPHREDGSLSVVWAAFRKNGTWVDHTLSTYWVLARRDDRGAKEDPMFKYVAPSLRRRWDSQMAGWAKGPRLDFHQRFLERTVAGVRALHEAGVPLLAGTDLGFPASCPGSGLPDELEHLVKAGLTPFEAIRAATSNSARYLERDKELGTVEQGKRADLLLLDANPLEDIRHTRRIRPVVMNGRLFNRAELDGLLAEVARLVASP